MFVDFFIHRPVFATVCALLIILAGAVCIPTLPIALYPKLAPPQVAVTSIYVGANADTVEKAVTIPLEESINGVEGMRYITLVEHQQRRRARSPSHSRPGTTWTSPPSTCRTAWPACRDGLPAAVNATGITIVKVNQNFVFGAGFFTRDESLLARNSFPTTWMCM